MMMNAAGKNHYSNKGMQAGDYVRGDGSIWRNGKMIHDGKGSIMENFPSGNQTSGYPGGYNQRGYGYSPATPYPLLNAFGQRAFTRDFNYLTPFKSPTYTGTNMPFTGSIPQGSNLTSVSQTYRKNPLLKSMFAGWIDPSKNVARRELTTTYNFNGPGS